MTIGLLFRVKKCKERKNMKLFVSGLINIETYLRIRSFPVTYYPVDYPFFGIKSTVSGVGYNIGSAARTLGDEVRFASIVGKDAESKRIYEALDEAGVSRKYIFAAVDTTPVSVVLYESGERGRRQMYCDLKNVQDQTLDPAAVMPAIADAELCALCNINFNRALLPIVKAAGKRIATDVHAINNIRDEFNKDFMKYADILFLSDEDITVSPREFITALKNEYDSEIIVMGMGDEGAILYERKTDKIAYRKAAGLGGAVNTVGAGDALFAAFLHYYGKYGAVDALDRAQVFAALKIQHDGGSIGFSSEEQVERVYNSIYNVG